MTHQIENPLLKSLIPVIYDLDKMILQKMAMELFNAFSDWLRSKNLKHSIVLNIGGLQIFPIYHQMQATQKLQDLIQVRNVLIDELCIQSFNKSCDKDGKLSLKGNINNDLLNNLMMHPFIKKGYPKSTGRHEFGSEFVHKIIQEWKHISHYDILRTFVSFTANSIWENILLIRKFIPQNWEPNCEWRWRFSTFINE